MEEALLIHTAIPWGSGIEIRGCSRPENNGWFTISEEGWRIKQGDTFIEGTGSISRNITQPKEKTMKLIELNDNRIINPEHITALTYKLFDIDPALSAIGMRDVHLRVAMLNGDEYTITDRKDVNTLSHLVSGDSGPFEKIDGLSKAVHKMNEYYHALAIEKGAKNAKN
jgi:hypothetical protein